MIEPNTQGYIGLLEVCVDSLESALNAKHGGADEIEVCSSLSEGGLTPSAGLVQEVKDMKFTHVNVMLRCRTGSDFCYSETEMKTMLADLKIFKAMGVNSFVFGALTEAKTIDEEACRTIVENAHPVPVTFHRAFDVCKNPLESLDTVIRLGFKRLLTSGQQPCAGDPAAIKMIRELILRSNGRITIIAGAGVTCENAKSLLQAGVHMLHSSCKKTKILPKVLSNLSMGSNESDCIFVTDKSMVQDLRYKMSKCSP